MKFEIFNLQGKRVFWTESEKCVPSKEELAYMVKNSRYKVKMDGKVYKPK